MFTLYDEFAGYGGSTTGAVAVPGVEPLLAANHNPNAIDVHALNYPQVEHYRGDIAKADIAGFPRADLFWASPACPPWTDARGVKRDFDQSTQGVLFDPRTGPKALDPAVARARALMEEVPRYLQAMRRKGRPVLGGVAENVVQVVKWDEFGRWRRDIEEEGYHTRLVALNAMHVTGPRHGKVAQSRNRFFLPFWHVSLGRDPDWDKWLRPKAYCPTCDRVVDAVQRFKDPKVKMGVYGIRNGQYVYRCPNISCRHQVIEPAVRPASDIIDWSLPPGQRIGERVDRKGNPDPLEPTTIARIEAGLAKQVRPLVVPVAKRAGVDTATSVEQPLRTQTCRRETGLVLPPFISLLRGGGSKTSHYPVDGPIPTVSAQGNHHGLVGAPESADEQALLVAYYGNGGSIPVDRPVGTLTTRDRYALISGTPPVETCTFRMLEPEEIGDGMNFPRSYRVLGSKRARVRGYGNAVPPAMAEVLVSALIETFSGESLEPAA